MEFEDLKHDFQHLEEKYQSLHSLQGDAAHVRTIIGDELAKALEMIRVKHEQKTTLHKKLSHYTVIEGSYNISISNVKLQDDPSDPGDDDIVQDFMNSSAKTGEGDEDERGEPFRPPSLVDDLLQELNVSEIQRLKRQLAQVRPCSFRECDQRHLSPIVTFQIIIFAKYLF